MRRGSLKAKSTTFRKQTRRSYSQVNKDRPLNLFALSINILLRTWSRTSKRRRKTSDSNSDKTRRNAF